MHHSSVSVFVMSFAPGVSGPFVFTHWGANECPAYTTKLYNGFIAGSVAAQGGGSNFLCMHPSPQHPAGYNDEHQEDSNVLFGTVYIDMSTGKSNGEAACVLCQDNTGTTDVYVQWGRTECSHGHMTQYSGWSMSGQREEYAQDNVCVDKQFAKSNENYISEFDSTSMGSRLLRTIIFTDTCSQDDYVSGNAVPCAVCSPVKPTRIFTSWGSRACSAHATKIYEGFMTGSNTRDRGGGSSFLCMHPTPQALPTVGAVNVNRLYAVEYWQTGTLDKNSYQEAACAVCEYSNTRAVYVQWGRTTCSNQHTTQYSGYIMSTSSDLSKAENICVDRAHAVHSASRRAKLDHSSKIVTSEMFAGAADAAYPQYREVACAVCSPSYTNKGD